MKFSVPILVQEDINPPSTWPSLVGRPQKFWAWIPGTDIRASGLTEDEALGRLRLLYMESFRVRVDKVPKRVMLTFDEYDVQDVLGS